MNNAYHNNEQLQKLHGALLEILDEVDRICKKNDIAYFLDSGTALGAIRHGGFIPWDDDIDIGMMREDYERFIAAASKELGDRFYLQTYEADPYYYKFNAKIRLNHTSFPESDSALLKHQGIFIDVFPFDYVPSDEKKALEMIARSRELVRPVVMTRPGYQPKGVKNLLMSMGYKLRSNAYYRERYAQFITQYRDEPTGHVACFSYHMLNKLKTKKLVFRETDMIPVKSVPFEDRTYLIMNNPDAYLTIMYGDYMQLPPEEKRVSHLSGEIIFDTREV